MDILCEPYFSDSSKSLRVESLKSAIAVWYAFTPKQASVCERYASLLSHEERLRAAAFLFPQDRNRFIYAHGLLRILTGQILHVLPDKLTFRRGKNGKPFLAIPHEGLFFSLSHARNLVACAFSLQFPVGVDVEYRSYKWDFIPLAQTLFHKREANAITSASSTFTARKIFFDVWTRKEAFLKATGEGLTRPLNSFCTLSPDGPIWENTPEGPLRQGQWWVRQYAPATQYSMAVAYPHTDSEVFSDISPNQRTDAVFSLQGVSYPADFHWGSDT